MNKISNLNYFWEKIEEAVDYLNTDDAQMTLLLENCLNELFSQSIIPKDSNFYYLKGYIYYSMRPQKLFEAKIEFEKSLELDSTNSHSKLYLAHSLYDLGDYNNAQKQFLNIAENSLPDWLMMKVDEMIVCCNVHLLSNTAEQDIQKFLKKYAPLDYLDDYPFELSKLLEQKGRKLENEALIYFNNSK